MRTYTYLKRCITSVVILCFLIGNISWLGWEIEIFPFYSWELFSYVPNLATDFGLKINAIDNQYIDEPVYFQDAVDLLEDTESIIAFNIIQTLGYAIENNDQPLIDETRKDLESIYFEDFNQVEYEIKKRTYYAAERWRTGTFESEKRLATYDSTKH